MKKILTLILPICLFVFYTTHASDTVIKEINKTPVTIKLDSLSDTFVTRGEVFNEFANYFKSKIPDSYQYINLHINGVEEGSELYSSLQVLVYLDLLPNKNVSFFPNKSISAYHFYLASGKIFGIDYVSNSKKEILKSRKASRLDFEVLKKSLQAKADKIKSIEDVNLSSSVNLDSLKEKQKIFFDVYNTLLKSHYDKNALEEDELISAATRGLAEGTGDRFTTYFPPAENKDFQESLTGKFEGIGSYVEMEEAGVLKIISPISGSPSEKAGLRGGDIVVKADGKLITPKTSINEAISWIKGPKGTPVILTIKRGKKLLEITVIRDTIVIKNVEHKSLNTKTYYIKLITFGEGVSQEFVEALNVLKSKRSVKKVIIDLRNNPGGYLDQVSDMLSYFVPKGEKTVVVKYLNSNKNYYSKGYDLIDFSDYRIIILQNSGSASASEIMAGTIKDYLPKSTLLGEQSYGKGSVQTIKPYSDGSSLKYTIAKWFTGKTQTGIDGVGIPVDVELEFDFEEYKKSEKDNQLNKAKTMR